MLITAVEPRKKSMSAVYIDGEFAMNLDTMTLLENRIKAGVEITDEELYSLIQKSDAHRAKERALNLITYRDHSKKELTEKIKRTCSEDATQQVVQHMEELGLIDDENFARKYANELLRKKHMSPKAIQYKLREKGISPETIEIIKEELEFDSYKEIRAVLDKKYSDYADDEKVKKRAIAALQRLGWSWNDIKCAMEVEY
ncbi:MAG: regulatory protein RecX [Acutalibacteraceae bacterium]|nr:regulatory protein RecX [Acutalibacteraceae bacterium]